MSRKAIAIMVAGIALLILLVATFRAIQNGVVESRSAGGATSQITTTTDANESEAPLRPGKNETPQERRQRMISGEGYRDDFKLSEQDVFLFVQAQGSNAVSLVAAFEASRNKDYLKAALEKFPTNAFVQSKALLWLELSDEQHAKVTEDFKKSAPTNAFANYIAARHAIKRGDTQTALAELMAAKGKGFEEYFRDSTEGLEAAYASAGYSEAEAKLLGSCDITLPHLAQIKGVGRYFLDLAEKAGAAGDTKTQQQMALLNWEIGQTLRKASGSVPVITELVGIAMENHSLRGWPAGTDFSGRPPTDWLEANNADRNEIRIAGPVFFEWFPTAPDNEIITYLDTLKNSGEREALKWLLELHPELKNAHIKP
jgi:hypothetical protein